MEKLWFHMSKAGLVTNAYNRLKTDILATNIPPGFQATEPEFALRLGMSRTPVREALLRLESDGLVELIPRRGARVLPVSIDDIREIYEILTALEPEAAAHLASRDTDPDALTELDRATEDMEQALREDDLDAWAAADDTFHRKLLQLHRNRRLIDFITRLFDQAHRVRIMTLRLRQPPVRSTAEHRDILRNIQAGNAEKVREVFRAHRVRAAQELLDILAHYRLQSL